MTIEEKIEKTLNETKIEAVSFRSLFKRYMELVAKKESGSTTEFINDCIRERLANKTGFLADKEAIKFVAEEMGIPEIGELPMGKILNIISEEKGKVFQEKWSEYHTKIEARLREYFRGEGVPGKNGEIVEASSILAND